MGQGVVLSGRTAAGKDAVCAFILILAGADGLHTLVKRGKGGACFDSLLRCTLRFATVQGFEPCCAAEQLST